MTEQEQLKEKIDNERAANKKALADVQEKLKDVGGDAQKVAQLQAKMKHLEVAKHTLDKQDEELRAKEKKTPWNVDTISKPAFSKTIINTKPDKPAYDDLTEEEKEVRMRDFVKDNQKVLKQFGMLRKYDDSRKFLLDHAHLACESTANYLVIWCINLQMEEKTELMGHVAHQCICMQVSRSNRCCTKRFNDHFSLALFVCFAVHFGAGQAAGRRSAGLHRLVFPAHPSGRR